MGPTRGASWATGRPRSQVAGVVAPVTAREDRPATPCPRRSPVATPIDPTSAGFLLAENRNMPMHVAGLHLFETPEGAGRDYARQMFEQMRDEEEIAPLFLKHPYRSIRTGGQLVWREDE